VNAADLPARVIRATGHPAGSARRPYVLDSQAAANAACERVGWVTIHPRSTTTRSTTMPSTTVKLSCNHAAQWVSDQPPVIGESIGCAKCKPAGDGSLRQRAIKAIRGPKVDPTAATAMVNGEVTEVPTEAPDADVIQFPNRIARTQAAKAAATRVRDEGGSPSDAAAASSAVIAMPIAQAPVANRSDTSRRQTPGKITDLNLSGARTAALQLALVGGATVPDDEADAAQAIQLALSSGAKRVDLDAAGVRVLLRNLHRVTDDEATSKAVARAAGTTGAWLAKFADAAGYSA
jgi:hypothetical protein